MNPFLLLSLVFVQMESMLVESDAHRAFFSKSNRAAAIRRVMRGRRLDIEGNRRFPPLSNRRCASRDSYREVHDVALGAGTATSSE